MRGFRSRFSRRLVGLRTTKLLVAREKKTLGTQGICPTMRHKNLEGGGGGGLIFAILPAIHKNKFPQIKITAKIFLAKIYSRVNIL